MRAFERAPLRAPLIAVALIIALAGAACSSGSTSAKSSTTTTPASTGAAPASGFGGAIPREVADNRDDWPTAGRDYDNSRATTDSPIRAANVGKLEVAWTAPLPSLGALTTVPLVVGNTVYLQGGSGQVAAVDRSTGKVRWLSAATGFNIGPFGVAVGDGRVYAPDGSSGVVALDIATGKPLWHRRLSATKTTGVDIQPIEYDGLVFAATVPVTVQGIYTGGDRGVISALDAKTGAVRWSFDTVQSPDLWGHPTINSGGGAWYPPAIDPARGLVYFGTANPAPFPGTKQFPNGASRPGANLYTDSLVALDIKTGKLRWYHQVTSHDLFDRDQVHALIAHTAAGREVVVSAGKSGVVVGLDPARGTVLWQTEVGHHEHDNLTELAGPTTVEPGTFGGVLTPPATADGVVYVPALNAPTTLHPDAVSYFGATLGTHPGDVVAIDAATGKVIWDRLVPGDPLGGATVVNDLVFVPLFNGTIVALRRSDGAIVWKTKAAGGINGELSVAGDLMLVPVGNATPPQLLALKLP